MSHELIDWREKHLNSISKSFCAAKWYNASIHLGHGYSGSCHLPLPHPIDLEEIKTNPSAIHNTKHKKQMRKMMLTGVRPAECSYCWKIEDIGRDNVSDRVYKSIIYQEDDIEKIKELQTDLISDAGKMRVESKDKGYRTAIAMEKLILMKCMSKDGQGANTIFDIVNEEE